MIKKYINGNYIVSIDRPNTIFESRKYTSLRFNENLDPSFPDSIDLKITNKCSWGCPFCHESSNPKGKDFDLDRTIKMLEKLPDYPIEIAIGGGNIFDCFDKFRELYTYIESRGMLPRFTINSKDLFDQDKYNKLFSLSDSTKPIIGISISNREEYHKLYEMIDQTFIPPFNFVIHIIVGIFPYQELYELLRTRLPYDKVLILGYKQFGRAKDSVVSNIKEWKNIISRVIFESRSRDSGFITFGFDNLAIDQLCVKDMLLDSEWDKYFLGQDFSHTMYVDAVEEIFAPTSRSPIEDRFMWSDYNNNITEYFIKNKKQWN